mmetsp:Transcript_81199/g.226023  ORF Transcript_81199/g.226023 Transcript_81199/m.226023 type:complete len:285 (+) Transcript_81199:92-946(+)|eukprot:CAMPEP_0117531868 /NCGR_PEP_ID=MMETSP0784-20121206/39078_1 /TAXON_ID=39447 /ORGANISM="" /LENGTH=284 /DNA_ID=CAMNT_0005328251 /DNA_START=92 /DNA_END=946 /DNA_ORIENTATION=-
MAGGDGDPDARDVGSVAAGGDELVTKDCSPDASVVHLFEHFCMFRREALRQLRRDQLATWKPPAAGLGREGSASSRKAIATRAKRHAATPVAAPPSLQDHVVLALENRAAASKVSSTLAALPSPQPKASRTSNTAERSPVVEVAQLPRRDSPHPQQIAERSQSEAIQPSNPYVSEQAKKLGAADVSEPMSVPRAQSEADVRIIAAVRQLEELGELLRASRGKDAQGEACDMPARPPAEPFDSENAPEPDCGDSGHKVDKPHIPFVLDLDEDGSDEAACTPSDDA